MCINILYWHNLQMLLGLYQKDTEKLFHKVKVKVKGDFVFYYLQVSGYLDKI